MSQVHSDGKLVCPFNKAHVILPARMATHISKCQRNYPDVELVTCDFNVLHRVRKTEFQYHSIHCPDRRVVEYNFNSGKDNTPELFPVKLIQPPPGEESWDNDVCTETYNPAKYAEKKNILRQLDVQPKSVRKNFKIEERHRLNRLDLENLTIGGSSKKVVPSPVSVAKPVREETPSEITDLLQKISAGKTKAYIPHQK